MEEHHKKFQGEQQIFGLRTDFGTWQASVKEK